jgi:hypothetical protein
MGDWDGDGNWDMALGFIDGPVKLFRNNGDMTFTDMGPFKIDGKTIAASDAGPCIVDWDGDGLLDLLLGDGEGAVTFYRGTAKGSLELAKDQNSTILPPNKTGWEPRKLDASSDVPFSPKTPGVRTKPFAADWNGDGKLDLLVGDFLEIQKPARNLTKNDEKRLKQVETEMRSVMQQIQKVFPRVQAKAMKSAGVKDWRNATAAQRQKYTQAYQKAWLAEKSAQKLDQRYRTLSTEYAKLRPQMEPTGVVWVYLRK